MCKPWPLPYLFRTLRTSVGLRIFPFHSRLATHMMPLNGQLMSPAQDPALGHAIHGSWWCKYASHGKPDISCASASLDNADPTHLSVLASTSSNSECSGIMFPPLVFLSHPEAAT